MMARHHKYQLVVAVGIGRQARTRRAVGKNAPIGLVADNVVDDAGAVFFLEADTYSWVVAHEDSQIVAQKLCDGRRAGPQPHMHLYTEAVVGQRARHMLHLVHTSSGVIPTALAPQ